VLAETTARLSSEGFNLPPIQAAVNVGAVRSVYLKNLAPFAHRNLETFTKTLTNRIKGVKPIPIDPGKKDASMIDIAKSLTKGELRSAIKTTVSGDVLGNFVVSFVLSSALQEIINESIMLDAKIRLRGELVAELQKQQSAPLPDLSNLLYYDLNNIIQIYADDYQPTDPVELERLMGPQEVYRAFLLSTIE
jgi:hypothetical protein